MEFSTIEIQLFFTVIVILACVYLALLCDFLRGSNQRLREQNVALKTRLETEGRIAVDAKVLMQVLQAARPPAPIEDAERSTGATPAVARGGRWRGEVRPAAERRAPRGDLERVVSAVARRGKDAFTAPEPVEAAPAPAAREPERPRPAAAPRPLEVVRRPEPVETPAEANVLRMWTMPGPAPEAAPASEPAPEVRTEIVPANGGPLPPGMHSSWTLASAMDRRERVSGLVVIIGINEFDKLQENLGATADELLRKLDQQLRMLIGPRDFACRPSADQYLLVFAQDNGPAAQRRLSHLSERLWDFQLRSLEASRLVLSWGAVEVEDELLAEAISEATERMRKTQRTRQRIPMEWSRRPAV